MTKNLETADTIVKLVLALLTIALFIAGIIAGAFAVLLVVLSGFILLINFTREIMSRVKGHKRQPFDRE